MSPGSLDGTCLTREMRGGDQGVLVPIQRCCSGRTSSNVSSYNSPCLSVDGGTSCPSEAWLGEEEGHVGSWARVRRAGLCAEGFSGCWACVTGLREAAARPYQQGQRWEPLRSLNQSLSSRDWLPCLSFPHRLPGSVVVYELNGQKPVANGEH